MPICYIENMRILVISDTHGNSPLLLRAGERAEPIDAAIHLGDGNEDADLLSHILDIEVIRVAGNCDQSSAAPRELLWECGGKRLLLVHGDQYGVRNGISRLEQRGIDLVADAVLFGHTHLATIITLSGILFINPGTLMKSSARTTFAIVEIDSSGIKTELQHIS